MLARYLPQAGRAAKQQNFTGQSRVVGWHVGVKDNSAIIQV